MSYVHVFGYELKMYKFSVESKAVLALSDLRRCSWENLYALKKRNGYLNTYHTSMTSHKVPGSESGS